MLPWCRYIFWSSRWFSRLASECTCTVEGISSVGCTLD